MLPGLISPHLNFAFVWIFIVDISSGFLYFPIYLLVAMCNFVVFWKDNLPGSASWSFWVYFSAWASRGWILVLCLWIHFPSSLHAVPPMVRNDSPFPSSWAQKGEGKAWIFLDVLLIGPGTHRSANLESRKTFLLVSSSFWVWGTERNKLIFLFM